MDLPILKYILILSLDLQQPSLNIYIYIYMCVCVCVCIISSFLLSLDVCCLYNRKFPTYIWGWFLIWNDQLKVIIAKWQSAEFFYQWYEFTLYKINKLIYINYHTMSTPGDLQEPFIYIYIFMVRFLCLTAYQPFWIIYSQSHSCRRILVVRFNLWLGR